MMRLFFRPLLRPAIVSLAVLLCTQTAAAQDLRVREIMWGFNGTVRPNQFNMVSVLLDNVDSDSEYNGPITLRKRSGVGQPIGAKFEEYVYLAPNQTRWVQFLPYFDGQAFGEWHLSWVGGGDELGAGKLGLPAVVMLDRDGGFASAARGIQHFPEGNFPVTVSGTGGLRSVVLDHMPRWERPRREAFRDWLLLGGSVHVLQETGGEFPHFTDELAVLNEPLEAFRVGSGAVFRHPVEQSAVNAGFKTAALGREDSFDRRPGEAEDKELEKAFEEARRNRSWDRTDLDYGWDTAERCAVSLSAMTRPDHNWGLIYFLAVVYIFCIFPGCYLIGRRRANYLFTYSAIVGAVVVFSAAFLAVGRRGYGEETIVHSVAVAQHIDDGVWDVTQWASAFVTRGDRYQLAYAGDGAVFSTSPEQEAVNGTIATAEAGQANRALAVDIPPFSSRPFVSRHRAQLKGLEARVTACVGGDRLSELVIRVGDVFPDDPLEIFALCGGIAYRMRRSAGELTLDQSTNSKIGSVLDQNELQSWSDGFFGRGDVTVEERYERLFHPLLAAVLSIQKVSDLKILWVPPDRIRLLVYAPTPAEFHLQGDAFPRQQGYTLFCYDLPREPIHKDTTP